jgi:hypothetical protein
MSESEVMRRARLLAGSVRAGAAVAVRLRDTASAAMISLKPAVAWLGPPLRALPWVVGGIGVAAIEIMEARQPDNVLANFARESTALACANYTVSDERDFALAMAAAGAAIALYGLFFIESGSGSIGCGRMRHERCSDARPATAGAYQLACGAAPCARSRIDPVRYELFRLWVALRRDWRSARRHAQDARQRTRASRGP